MATQTQAENLGKAVTDFIQSINDLATALKACREAGLSQVDIQRAVFDNIPDEDKPAFQQQWPMISMLLSAL